MNWTVKTLHSFKGLPGLIVALALLWPRALSLFAAEAMSAAEEDPNLWLEDITGAKALDWVRAHNAASTRQLEADAGFSALQDRLLAILNSRQRIPPVTRHGRFFYNFWRDGKNPRGLWRRTTLEEYKKDSPAWETVLDLDQLAAAEKENWVWHGYTVLKPRCDRCLIELSRGGADASAIREFDLRSKQLARGGFTVPEAKSAAAWRDRDTLYIATDFGPGSLTRSGYPRIVKEWRRGTPLSQARTVFEAQPEDNEVSVFVEHDHGRVYEFIRRQLTSFTDETRLRRGRQWVRIEKPADATASTFGRFLLLRLRSDWTVNNNTFPAGALLAADLEAYLEGRRDLSVLFQPTDRACLSAVTETRHDLVLTVLENVQTRPWLLRFSHGQWQRAPIPAPAFGSVGLEGIDPDHSDEYFMTETGFLTPSRLCLGVAGKPGVEEIKSLPAFFDAGGLEVRQWEAVSKDGTRVPYFQVARTGLKADGENITLLTGYGGFEIPSLPGYNAVVGAAWLERGGVYVLANIRGGGEFGPRWHEAARKQNRQRAYDDFIAVAEDLIGRKITSPRRLGIRGGSNGGLLMGVMLTERPDLFGAIHCGSPLLDMRRYNKLLAGASWMDEYGDPDKAEDWAYLQKYSPYQNARAGVPYPPILITTSTRDDRVHPGHARKMAARLEEQGHAVLYYENIEGGHGAAANSQQAAFMNALAYTFLWASLSR
jgi:prolyl oligopeptidase